MSETKCFVGALIFNIEPSVVAFIVFADSCSSAKMYKNLVFHADIAGRDQFEASTQDNDSIRRESHECSRGCDWVLVVLSEEYILLSTLRSTPPRHHLFSSFFTLRW